MTTKIPKAVFAGSFDPITKGHLWLIEKALDKVEHLVVLVAYNPEKKGLLSIENRIKAIEESVSHLANVSVESLSDEFVALYCKRNGIKHLIRGIRNSTDLEFEQQIETVNKVINPEIETLMIHAPKDLVAVSSSMVRSLVGFPHWKRVAGNFVPPSSIREIQKTLYYNGLSEKWKYTFGRLDSVTSNKWFSRVILAYSEPQRAYHDLKHLSEILEAEEPQTPTIIAAAFFHDIVYDPKSQTNEEDSAQLWLEFAKEIGFEKFLVKDVFNLILATKSHNPTDENGKIKMITAQFLDLDLGILAAPLKRFEEYDAQIREEYAFVPEAIYQVERAKILQGFLSRPKIFLCGDMKKEAAARVNLTKVLNQ